jgi:beta-carotene ketolase (CrtW type)
MLNLIYFWVVPALLSTVQLFYFGTYLPHRELTEPYKDQHRARSNNYSNIFSLLTCYHFGYHWEHHEYPHIAWWRLPLMRKQAMKPSTN